MQSDLYLFLSGYPDIVFVVETSERIQPLIAGLFQAVIQMVQQAQVGAAQAHVALVHFSSPDTRTAVQFNLLDYSTVAQITAAISAINVNSILGISDLNR